MVAIAIIIITIATILYSSRYKWIFYDETNDLLVPYFLNGSLE